MADFPFKTFGHLGTIVPGIGRNGTAKDGGGGASGVWTSANRAVYIPFKVELPVVVTAIGVPIGATSSGNIDVGIYTSDGVRLVSSGSTAMALAATLQTFNITDTLLGPGSFYFACAVDNATATVWRVSLSARRLQALGLLIEGSAFPLPATATFAAVAANNLFVAGLLLAPRTTF